MRVAINYVNRCTCTYVLRETTTFRWKISKLKLRLTATKDKILFIQPSEMHTRHVSASRKLFVVRHRLCHCTVSSSVIIITMSRKRNWSFKSFLSQSELEVRRSDDGVNATSSDAKWQNDGLDDYSRCSTSHAWHTQSSQRRAKMTGAESARKGKQLARGSRGREVVRGCGWPEESGGFSRAALTWARKSMGPPTPMQTRSTKPRNGPRP